MAFAIPLAISNFVLPVLSASTFHVKQREWISPFPGIDESDSLEKLLFDAPINQEVSNSTRRCASKLPQCIWMKHLDEASEQLHQRRGSILKIGVTVFCLFLVSIIVLTEWMSEDLSASYTDFTPSAGPRVASLQTSTKSLSPRASPMSLSTRLQSHSGGGVSSSQSSISPYHGGNVPAKPAPICPDLVSTVESCYAVGLRSIDTAAGPVQIHGRGQKLLLTAQIQNNGPGNGAVILTMGDARGPLLASVNSAGGRLTVQDRHKRPYGKITLVGNLAYSLTCGGVEAMKIRTDSRSGRILLVNSNGGAHLASAAKLHDVGDLPSPEDYLGISVVAGMDPILTILCIIGVMALST